MTEQRPIQPTPIGALRFNTDSGKLEYFDGNQYVNITTDSPEAKHWWNSWNNCWWKK